MRTFFTLEGGDSEFAKFTVPILKAFLNVRSHSVPVSKQERFARAMPKTTDFLFFYFFLSVALRPLFMSTVSVHSFCQTNKKSVVF